MSEEYAVISLNEWEQDNIESMVEWMLANAQTQPKAVAFAVYLVDRMGEHTDNKKEFLKAFKRILDTYILTKEGET